MLQGVSNSSPGLRAIARTLAMRIPSSPFDTIASQLAGSTSAGNSEIQKRFARTRLVREELPTTDVLILTMHFSEEVAREVVRCGARGYLLKSDADIELIHAVRHIQQHKLFFTGKLATRMAESFVRDTGARNDNNNNDAPLSAREREVVQLLATGKSNKEAAAMIGVSTRTVESHRNHIMRKMDFRSFSDLIRFAIRSNLIQA